MQRGWVTGIALAGALGSGGAAFAGMANAPEHTAPTVPAMAGGEEGARAASSSPRVVSYQIGSAGTVTLAVGRTQLTVADAAPGTGWTVPATSDPGTRVTVQFTDSLQLVTFAADLNGDDVVVTLENVPAPGSTATPTEITVVEVTPGTSPAPMPATPPSQPADPASTPQPVSSPAPTSPPPPAATTAPSSHSDDHGGEHDDDHEQDDHGGEHDDD